MKDLYPEVLCKVIRRENGQLVTTQEWMTAPQWHELLRDKNVVLVEPIARTTPPTKM